MSRLIYCCRAYCRRVLLGLIVLSASVFAAAEVDPVDVGSPTDFLDVTSHMSFQPSTSDATPDATLFQPISRHAGAFERYDRGYWFRLEFVNRSAVPVRRLVELTHGRLGTLVARLQSEDTDREILRTAPIIALTAHAMPEFRRRAEEAGMTDYVTKPIQKSTLLKAMLNARSKAPAGDANRLH